MSSKEVGVVEVEVVLSRRMLAEVVEAVEVQQIKYLALEVELAEVLKGYLLYSFVCLSFPFELFVQSVSPFHCSSVFSHPIHLKFQMILHPIVFGQR